MTKDKGAREKLRASYSSLSLYTWGPPEARQALMVRVIINMKAEGTATMHTFPTDLGGKTCGIRIEDEQDD